MEMDKIQEQWPEWQTVELVGKGTFGSVYKAKRKYMEIYHICDQGDRDSKGTERNS